MKRMKKVFLFVMVICLVLGQSTISFAAQKTTKYTVTLNKTVYTMEKGKTVKLKATLNKAAKGKKIEWTSSNKKVATVSASGKVKAQKNGNATITAKIKGTKVKATCKIVVGTPVKSVKINSKKVSLKSGQTFTLKTTISPKKATSKKVTYKTSNKKVATVTKKGVIKAVGAGTAKITVTAADGSGKNAVCKVTVTEKKVLVTGVSLSETNINMETGTQKKLTASVTPVDATNKSLTWSSSNTAVATVDSSGTVSAVGAGTASVIATAADGSGKNAVCEVTVVKSVTKVTISETGASLVQGEQKQLTATVEPGDATDKTIAWSSSNAAIASVDKNGLVTAKDEGEATIYATAANGVKASCAVRVSCKNVVDNQTDLNKALASKMVTNIIYNSDKAENITIAAGDYSSKTLEINAPNADVTNNGRFSKVTINAIAKNTYTENGNNVIYFNAANGRLVVSSRGIATINLSGNGNQVLNLENNGLVNSLHVPGKSSLNVTGPSPVPVTLTANAAGTSITTETELSINASAKWNMTILPGAENTKAVVDNANCVPSILGIGCIPVTLSQEQSIVNVLAEMGDNLDISQKVAIEGSVKEYTVSQNSVGGDEEENDDTGASTGTFACEDSNGAEIYLLPYTLGNIGMTTENCGDYMGGQEPVATTADGHYIIQNVKIGNYWLIVKKDGFRPEVQNITITSFNSDIYSSQQVFLLSDDLTELANAPSISGQLVDGLTGEPITETGIQVVLRAGNGNISGAVIQTTTTGASGRYTFTDIPTGVYTVEANDLRQGMDTDAIRYNSANTTILVAVPYLPSDNYNFVMNQKMHSITGTGLVQFTLEWGTEESGASSDIDSHLIGPRADGNGVFHTYYSDMEYEAYDNVTDDWIRYADLDVDDTEYVGPEHTTIYNETPGVYRFYVHNYSERNVENSDAMANSSVKVTVTIGTSVYTYYCPVKTGNLWYLCDYNSVTHTIIPRNEVSTFIGETSDIGLTEEELNERYLEDYKENAADEIESLRNYLDPFEDSDKKTEYMNQIAAWTQQLEQITNYLDARTLYNEIDDEYEQLGENTPTPSLTADNLVYSNSYSCTDEEGNAYMELVCNVILGDLSNPQVVKSDDYTAELSAVTDSTDYPYVMNVTYTNGMVIKYYVRLVENTEYVTEQISECVEDCENVLSTYEEHESITAARQKLAELQAKATNIRTVTELNKLREEIEAITDQYQNAIRLTSLSVEGHDEDWWTYLRRIYDDEDVLIAVKEVLRIDCYCYMDSTATDILNKMTLSFGAGNSDSEESEASDFEYEVKDSDDSSYDKVIRVTSDTGLVRNFYVDIYIE